MYFEQAWTFNGYKCEDDIIAYVFVTVLQSVGRYGFKILITGVKWRYVIWQRMGMMIKENTVYNIDTFCEKAFSY